MFIKYFLWLVLLIIIHVITFLMSITYWGHREQTKSIIGMFSVIFTVLSFLMGIGVAIAMFVSIFI